MQSVVLFRRDVKKSYKIMSNNLKMFHFEKNMRPVVVIYSSQVTIKIIKRVDIYIIYIIQYTYYTVYRYTVDIYKYCKTHNS